jgi:cytochrome c biogenesis protein
MTETLAPPRPAAGEPPPRGSRLPEIPGPLDSARMAWRWLRRMSTALGLLFAMAAAAVIATFVPQEPVTPQTVAAWRTGVDAAGQAAGPGTATAAVLDAIGVFDVFGSWWFTTLLVLLFVSLTGCLLPRYRAFAKVARRPPAAGRDLERLFAHRTLPTSLPAEEALAVADGLLRRRRFRRRRLSGADSPTGTPQLAAERGHWREGGSLIFHSAFYVLLVGVIVGQTFGFTGQVNLVEGRGFTDTRLSYDFPNPGRFFSLTDHPGFTVTLEDFEASYHEDLTPADYVSRLTVDGADGTRTEELRVNHPVRVDGFNLYQARFGMAPRVIVRLASDGRVLHDAPVVLNQVEGTNQWTGVAKVPVGGARPAPGAGPLPEMALELALLPDAAETADGRPVSASPRPDNPLLFANVFVGDLGLERPVPASELLREWPASAVVDTIALPQGRSVEVAGGAFTVEFAELPLWSGLQVSRQPARPLLLAAAVLLLLGLVPSLYAYRRRLWVAARPAGTGSEVVLAGVALQRHAAFDEEFASIAEALRERLPAPSTTE